jgi:MFS family permease
MFGSFFVAMAHTFPTDWSARVFRWIDPNGRPPAAELRTLYMIVLGRVLQALGAGAMAPVTMAMVGDIFPKGKRARPIGVVGAIDTVGWMLGHLYGGVMVRFFGANGAAIVDFFNDFGLSLAIPTWRTLFWFNLVTGGFTLIAVWISLRGVPQTRSGQRFDFLGTALMVAAVVALNVGLGATNPEAPSSASGFQSAQQESSFALPLLVLAVLAFLLFLLVESRVRHPLIDLKLFRIRNVSAASFTNICVGACLTIGLVTLPILVNIRESQANIEGVQQAALITGILLSGLTIPMALGAIPGAWLSDRAGYRVATVTGMGLTVLGFVLIGVSWRSDTSYWLMGGQMAVAGFGMGLTISPIGAAVINAADAAEHGAASAMVLALRLVGMTLALSGLSDFAINRVNKLVAERGAALANTDNLYLVTSVDVVRELFLLGAALSIAALMVALWMRGGRASELAPHNNMTHP